MPEDIRPGIAGDSRREKICQYMVEQIGAEGKPDGLLVSRQRSLPLEAKLLPAALVYLVRETAERIGALSTVTQRETVFRVEIRASGEPSDQVLDPLVSWVVQQVMADYELGGLADGVDESGSQWIQEETKDLVIGAVGIDFTVRYQTEVHDLIGAP